MNNSHYEGLLCSTGILLSMQTALKEKKLMFQGAMLSHRKNRTGFPCLGSTPIPPCGSSHGCPVLLLLHKQNNFPFPELTPCAEHPWVWFGAGAFTPEVSARSHVLLAG